MTTPPIARSLARLSPTDDWFDARLGPAPDGWLRAAGIGRDPSVVADLERLTREAIEAPDKLSVGTMMMWRWGEVARAVTTVYVREQRVPDLDPATVAFVPYTDETPTRIAFSSAGFACLPDDADADHPDASPARDIDDLRGILVRRVEGFVAPAVDAVGSAMGLGRKAAWGLAAGAALAEMIEPLAEAGEPERAAAELDALLAHATELATAPPSAEVFLHDGTPHLALRIGACCRAYRWLDRPRQMCAFCPLLSRDERLARWAEPEGDH